MFPHDFVGTRIRMNFAFKVHIITLLDVIRVHVRAELQVQNWDNCKKKIFVIVPRVSLELAFR